MPLAITRRVGERFFVGVTEITVLECRTGRTKLLVSAPREIPITRDNPPAMYNEGREATNKSESV